jgi:hypothetical protein
MQLKNTASAQFEACLAWRNRSGAFEKVPQPTIRCGHVCTVEGGENFEDLLRVVLDTQKNRTVVMTLGTVL